MKFEIMRNCNCHITFDNEVTVSILIGGGSYSDNHDDIDLIGHEVEQKKIVSGTAEIGAWIKGGEWITGELRPDANDDVLGWQTTEQVLDFLNKAASYHQGYPTILNKEEL